MKANYQKSGHGIKSGYVIKNLIRVMELNLKNIVEVNFAKLPNF